MMAMYVLWILFSYSLGLTSLPSYVILVSSGSVVGLLVSGFVVAYSPDTWRDAVWITVAIIGFTLLAIYLFFPESTFDRPPIQQDTSILNNGKTDDAEIRIEDSSKITTEYHESLTEESGVSQDGSDLSLPKVWASFFRVDHNVSFFLVFTRPLTFLISPLILWTIILYGSSLASQIILM